MPSIHPDETLREDFLKPLGITPIESSRTGRIV
jgi:hypothetical protein